MQLQKIYTITAMEWGS